MDDEEEAKLRTRIRELEEALGLGHDALSFTFRLSPTLGNLMGLLLTLPTVTPELVKQKLGVAADAKVVMYRLRKHLRDWNIKIHSHRNVGYWLDPADKKRVRAFIASQEVPNEPNDQSSLTR